MLNPIPQSPCGILYVDDEEKALKYFRMAFGQKYRVLTAGSGAEGLDVLRREGDQIGIVLSDQRMPGMLGAEFLAAVRESHPQIVRLLTTAYSDLESAILAVNRGHIYQYVVKPWEIPDLGMVLQRAADYHRVTTERNGLLALKMSTVQRIAGSDRLKTLLAAAEGLAAPRREALLRALGALVGALPVDPGDLRSGPAAFRPTDFEAVNLLRDGYREAVQVLAALPESPDPSAAEAALPGLFGPAFGPASVASAAGVRTVGFSEAADRGALRRSLFGVLTERNLPAEAAEFLGTLAGLAPGGGSLSVQVAGEVVGAFDLAETPSPEDLIRRLYERYAAWDIASR